MSTSTPSSARMWQLCCVSCPSSSSVWFRMFLANTPLASRSRLAARSPFLKRAAGLLDEPTTALDVTTKIEVLWAFRKVVRQLHTTAVYVSHDLPMVAQLADRVVVLHDPRDLRPGDGAVCRTRGGSRSPRNARAHADASLTRAAACLGTGAADRLVGWHPARRSGGRPGVADDRGPAPRLPILSTLPNASTGPMRRAAATGVSPVERRSIACHRTEEELRQAPVPAGTPPAVLLAAER